MIDIAGLRKSYGDRLIIDGVTLSVPQGTVCGVLGPSGSGKSTLLRCVNFLEPYEAGEIRIDGELVGYDLPDGRRTPKSRREVARMRSQCCIVFQQFNLFSHMTALENVTAAPVRVRGLARGSARELAAALLEKVGLSARKDAYPAFLSGGEQQRVAIARALAMQPKVLLLDEVTSALDPERAAEVLDVIAALAREGMTMMMVTHQVHFAREVCRHIVFMDDGRIVEEGGPAMLASPTTERLRSFLRHLRLS
jgi:polar amino acid transport system ATP-binding protein